MAPDVWIIVLPAPAEGRGASLAVTLERLQVTSPPARTVVVTRERNERHQAVLGHSLRGRHVLRQPRDRGTANAIALGMLPVLDSDPSGIVVVTPCESTVQDLERFRAGVHTAVCHVRQFGGIVVGGVEATGPAEDVGWIVPRGSSPFPHIRAVQDIRGTPGGPEAADLYREGAVWNTSVIVARARTLLALLRQHVPETAAVLVRALCTPPADRENWLSAAYERLTPVDFVSDLLSAASDLSAYVWPASVGWAPGVR